jgi:hypothetical protein
MIGDILSFFAIYTIIPTIILEFVVYSLFVRKKYLELLGYAVLINCFTWPLAALVLGYFMNLFWIVEFFMFLVEIPLIKLLTKVSWWKALIISLVANLITILAGLFIIG